MKILVTFALEAEFTPWRSRREFRRQTWGAADVYVATIGEAEVGVALTGVGPRQAALAAWRSIGSAGDSLKFCISSGLAGALRPEYQIGQVLAASKVFAEPYHDSPEEILESSPSLISFAAELGAIPVGRFFTAGRAIIRAEEKRHLGRGADAVEMETFEILRQCAERGIPAAAIRAISDTVDENLPFDMNEIFNNRGQVSVPQVITQLARHPLSLPGLVNLGRHSRRAAESLAQFLDRYIAFVAQRASNFDARITVAAAS